VERNTHLFTFLFIKEVPPDTNASERTIRNVKVKGQFKIEAVVNNLAKIKSVSDNVVKKELDVLKIIELPAKFEFNFQH